MSRKLAVALFASQVLAPNLATAAELTGVVSVIDGETDEVHGARIRLHG